MEVDKSTRIITETRIRQIVAVLVILVGIIYLTKSYWHPYSASWLCGRMADELSEEYTLVVRYGDPSEFYISPLPAQTNNPEEGFFIGKADPSSAHTAMLGLKQALRKYPKALINKYLKAVFVSGIIKIYNVQGSGTYLHSWIYMSATPKYEPFGPLVYEKIVHHEFSSLLFLDANFPAVQWYKVNDDSFKYLENPADIVKQAAIENRRDPSQAPTWHHLGFVHDYGMASLENDFNTYAELAMTYPEKLKELAHKYPKIKAKTQILVEYYNSLAPELKPYFESAGLTGI